MLNIRTALIATLVLGLSGCVDDLVEPFEVDRWCETNDFVPAGCELYAPDSTPDALDGAETSDAADVADSEAGDAPVDVADPGPDSDSGDGLSDGEADSDGESETVNCTPAECQLQADDCNDAACDDLIGECVVTPKEGDCDDGDPCTYQDSCSAGSCVGTAYECPALECQDSECLGDGTCSDPVTKDGWCFTYFFGKALCIKDGETLDPAFPCLACDVFAVQAANDGADCTAEIAHACKSGPGKCSGGSCDAANDLPDGSECTDGNPCTTESCMGGACEEELIDCNDGDSCTWDSCSSGQCLNTANAGQGTFTSPYLALEPRLQFNVEALYKSAKFIATDVGGQGIVALVSGVSNTIEFAGDLSHSVSRPLAQDISLLIGLSSSGEVEWERVFAEDGLPAPWFHGATTAGDAVYVAGVQYGGVNLDPGGDGYTPQDPGHFVARYSSTGILDWIIELPEAISSGISVDYSGSIVATAFVYGEETTIETASGPVTLEAALPGNLAVASVGADTGEIEWVTKVAETSELASDVPSSSLVGPSISESGSIAVGWHTIAPTTVLTNGGATESPVQKAKDAFVARLNPSGGVAWAMFYSGVGDDDLRSILYVGSASAERIAVSGRLNPGEYTLGQGSTITYDPALSDRYNYMLALDPTGSAEWMRTTKGLTLVNRGASKSEIMIATGQLDYTIPSLVDVQTGKELVTGGEVGSLALLAFDVYLETPQGAHDMWGSLGSFGSYQRLTGTTLSLGLGTNSAPAGPLWSPYLNGTGSYRAYMAVFDTPTCD